MMNPVCLFQIKAHMFQTHVSHTSPTSPPHFKNIEYRSYLLWKKDEFQLAFLFCYCVESVATVAGVTTAYR